MSDVQIDQRRAGERVQLDEVLSQVPVYRYWSVTPHQGARTLLTFADNAPALLERTIRGPKTGHVLLMVGTVKGLFLLESAPSRRRCIARGPLRAR